MPVSHWQGLSPLRCDAISILGGGIFLAQLRHLLVLGCYAKKAVGL
jgi:hypothetical protein